MKNTIIIFIVVMGLTAVSCKRDIQFPTISVTPPALEIQVEGAPVNDTYPKIEGATVNLFTSDSTALASGVTDANGHVTFTKDQLKVEGIFNVTATKGSLTNSVTTPFLLLNDGVTLQIIQLQ